MNVSLRRYYKSFGSLYAFVAGIPFLLPLLNLYQSHATEYLYPPLGDAQSLFFGLTFALMLMTTFAVYVSCRAARRIHPLVPFLLILAFTIGAGCVMALDIRCVRVVDVPYSFEQSHG